ncbi:MAG: hypothetical protein IKO55_05175, partial [Kiritimatiellae bacterium]|nr:hypothetical protein [Kiritimatiellia bacterium]
MHPAGAVDDGGAEGGGRRGRRREGRLARAASGAGAADRMRIWPGMAHSGMPKARPRGLRRFGTRIRRARQWQ